MRDAWRAPGRNRDLRQGMSAGGGTGFLGLWRVRFRSGWTRLPVFRREPPEPFQQDDVRFRLVEDTEMVVSREDMPLAGHARFVQDGLQERGSLWGHARVGFSMHDAERR